MSTATYDQFIEELRDPTSKEPVLSPQRFIAALHIDLQTLATQAGVHRNTVTRAPGSVTLQRFLRDVARVIAAATDISGDVSKALFWYRNHPLAEFDYHTAEQLVVQGRADDVVRYVSSLSAGPAG